MGADQGIGRFESPVIYLNRDNGAVDLAYEQQNALATTLIAAALVSADTAFAPRGQLRLRLRGFTESSNQAATFSSAMGAIVDGDIRLDGRPALKAVK